MKGPAPEPTRLKILKGVRPCRINKNEPKPRTVSARIPSGWEKQMSTNAKIFWRRHAPRLVKLGLLTEIDLDTFRILCEIYNRWRECASAIKKHGMIYENPESEVLKFRPEVGIIDKLEKTMLSYLQQFGMSPSSRGGISVEIPIGNEDEDLD